jgi:AraC family transcriptional regulator
MTHPTEQTYRQRVLAVQLFIQENLAGDLSLDRLARVACFSPYHFHRIFKGIVGEAVSEYVRRLRLESAAVALKTTRQSILDVALDAGYGTHEAFTRAFRQMFGLSPSEFRAGRNPLYLAPRETSTMTTTTPLNPVRIETLPPRRVAFIRHVGPFDKVEPTFGRLAAWAGRQGLFRPGTQMLGICLDDPDVTPADKIRFDCCIPVDDSVSPEGEVGVQTIAGGDHAVVTHQGPYSRLGETYGWLYGVWLPTSGREPANAPPFEVYRNSPADTPAEELLTDLCLPLAPR